MASKQELEERVAELEEALEEAKNLLEDALGDEGDDGEEEQND